MPKPRPPFNSSKLFEKFFPAAAWAWAALVFYHFFPLQKAFDISFLGQVFSGLGSIHPAKFISNGWAALKVLACDLLVLFTLWRWGRAFLHWLGLDLGNILLRFSMEMALGILFFNWLWLGLGLELLWFDSLNLILMLFFLGFALADFFANYMKFQKLPRFEWPGWFYAGLGAMGFLFLVFSIAQGFVPEIYFDGLVYHLSALSFWKFHHGITDFYTNLYAHFPFGAELYFLNGFFLQGGEAAKTLNAFGSGLLALAAAGWVMEERGLANGLLTWFMVLSLPLVSLTVWTTQNDVLLAYFLILFFYALTRWVETKQNWKWAVAAGLLGGGAMSVKYTAVVAVAAGLLAAGISFKETLGFKHWPQWGVIKVLLFLGLAPWLLKNFVFTGNPFYPYLSHWMGGFSIPPEKMNSLMDDHVSPFQGGFSPAAWLGRVLMTDLDKTIGPFLFAFVPFLFLPGKRGSTTKFLAVLSALLLTGGFLISHQPRLMIPGFLTCFLLMAFTLGDSQKRAWTRTWGWILLVLGVVSFLALGRVSALYYRSDQIWLGKENRREFIEASPLTKTYAGLTSAAEGLPETDRLLIVGDSRSFYYPRDFVANSVFDEQVLEGLARREKDGEGVWRGLRKMGIDGIAVAGMEGRRLAGQYPYYRLSEGEWKKLEDFIQHHTELIYYKDLNGIFRLQPSPVKRESPIPPGNFFNFLGLLGRPMK